MTASRGAAVVLSLGLLAVPACAPQSDTALDPSSPLPAVSGPIVEDRTAIARRMRPAFLFDGPAALGVQPHRGLPPVQVPDANPLTVAKAALGRRLFYDTRLSGNGRFACATCHQQRRAFTDGRPRAIGSTGERHPRGTMSLTNVAYNASFGWADSAVRTLEQQMAMPLFNEHPVEMGVAGRAGEVLARFTTREDAARFRAAFPNDPRVSLENIVYALASFERTLLSGDSPFDRYLYRDDRGAMSAAALRGMELFFSDRLRCATCHGGFNLSGPVLFPGGRDVPLAFHNTGVVNASRMPAPADRGLFERTGNPGDIGRFRAPTLRNIAVTAPYMHDGSLPTLEAVIAHYASGGGPAADTRKVLRPFGVTASETADLVAFLRSLTDESFLANPAFTDPALAGAH